MSVPEIAQQLVACGVPVFPCSVRYDQAKSKWQKRPLTVAGEHWAATAQRPLTDPDVSWGGTTVIGVLIPPGVVVLDLDTYKPGCSREAAEAAFGCPVPWGLALIQATIGGGEHFAFKAPDWVVKQGDNFGGVGVDTRVSGKGFICSGAGYTPLGFGCRSLAYPDALPELPDGCRGLLEHSVKTEPSPLPPTAIEGKDTETIIAALSHVSPDVGHKAWISYGMALRHHFQSDPDLGFSLFDQWSYGAFGQDGCPPSYIPEDVRAQYWALKPSRGDGKDVTISTVYYGGLQGGWVPPPSFDTSKAFGEDAAPTDAFNALVTRIQESGTDVTQTTAIVDEVIGAQCNALQRDLLTLTLKAALKDAKLLDKALSDKLDNQLRPDSMPMLAPVVAQLPDVLDVADIAPVSMSHPTGLHGLNAKMMQAEVFGGRLRQQNGILRWWSGRAWQSIPEEVMANLTYNALMPNQCKAPNVAGTRSALIALTEVLPPQAQEARVYFQDCIVDLSTGRTVNHQPENHNTSCLEVPYSEVADAPNWFAFIDTIFGGTPDGNDRTSLLQEIMGWAMLQDDLNVQKVVALDGASRAGKGVILEVLRSTMGREKCGIITFSNLDDGKTQSSLRRHDVVIDMEAKPPQRQGMKTAISFMNKVASNEEASIQLLNTQQPWAGRLNCKLIISCNGMPALLDDSGATTNRFLVLYFNRSFAGQEDRMLLSRLKPELSAIAAWALVGAGRLVSNGGVFTAPATSAEALGDLRSTNQPLTEFIESYLEFDPDSRCHTSDVWLAYKLYAAEANIKLCTRNTLTRSLKQALLGTPGEYVRVLRIGDEVSSGYSGFAVRDLTLKPVSTTVGAFTPAVVK